MRKFIDEDFLLTSETAKHLYHDYAKKLPIVDYHCHLSPKEIYEDCSYENITQLWLNADHYKWRQMRSNGVEEKYITGDGSDRIKFKKWVSTLEMAIGNPLYHWSHLELKRYFDYDGYLSEDTEEEVWKLTKEKLSSSNMSARNLIRKSKVEVLCTTDDPVDSLKWHRMLREDGFEVKVLPAFRPDRALDLEKEDFASYITKLAEVSGVRIESFDELIAALEKRMDYFSEHGCQIADHGLEYVMYRPAAVEEINDIFVKRMAGEMPDRDALLKYKTAFMLEMGKAYAKRGWVMQLHYGVQRNLNKALFNSAGADVGIDAINTYSSSIELGQFLNVLEEDNLLPKTILYSLNPTDNAAIGTVMGCFQGHGIVGKIQQGSAWWFNDNKTGMMEQMTSLANLGLLGNFVGMLTDSRSFLSYTRHEYFRRIMCDLIGEWVEKGEYPADEKALKKIVEGISYRNAIDYFAFK